MLGKLPNFVGFQVIWFALVGSAAAGQWGFGLAVGAAWLVFHLWREPGERATDLRLAATAAILGFAADSALAAGGLVAFPASAATGAFSPPWMVALWAGFSLTLGYSLSWLQGRYVLAMFAGAVCGPLAYLGGQALGAIDLTGGGKSLAAIGAVFAAATPLLFRIRLWLARANSRAGDECQGVRA